MLKILVIDEIQERALEICEGLTRAGHMVAAVLPDAIELHDRVQQLQPDVVLINTESPSRDTLENLAVLDRKMPRPVLMFAEDDADDVIRQAMRAGVSSYVVDGLAPERLQSLLKVATLRFEEYLALRQERDEAQRKLSERTLVDRAKGILMKSRNMSEDEAYHALRKLAMERGRKIGEVAEQIISAADLLLG
ncbi:MULTISPECIES: ANTAR domain-containing response regulator [Uliginosibacterium]|uniref:ANTAR domain-containing protein n=1 Tax=Uliginosibacterium aquaticum TaxID=2731212 RepID=A0ABX2IDG1_9RHOO|nr:MULTISPECIES: ANTAR domain-containing protein [Uliginosibacterium]MDO6385729.1 ANTAR domain-containing protein [Uliginosibacterium sp. 31-12]NSL54362.1 ANTAR domain-containing protein [Uliginosibacterium aquaticum]PLK49752.1 response regulator [Uliginosibacterium sp. TH139]